MKLITYIAISLLCISCTNEKGISTFDAASKVEVREVDGISNFYVNDSLYQIKGVGFNFEYSSDLDALSKTGANTIRTWGTKYADTILQLAENYNLMVALGINIGKELHGFDYNDSAAVSKQFERTKIIIDKYKNHPNILCWVVGNELNLLFNDDGSLKMVNPKVYDAMAQIIDYIHKEDPNHPATVTFAGVNEAHLKVALERMPNVDFISVQVYADLENIEEKMKMVDISKPYLITETGPKGHWEMPKTEWGREVEEASGPKADGIIHRLTKGLVNNNSGKCLGGFAFVWGHKHERTPTWYGMLHEDGKQTEYVDELTKLWTGNYPKNRAPRVDSLLLDNKKATDNIYLKPNTEYTAKVFASDPDGDLLNFEWEIASEVDKRSLGGEKEEKPLRTPVEIVKNKNGELIFLTPKDVGEYRILAYVYDGKDKAGNANIPFFVKQ